MAEAEDAKGRICVTGGTGFLASWTVKCLLENGYSVNATTRTGPGGRRDVSYLTSLPGAAARLKIFHADLDNPESFTPAIEGCVGVFHMAHPLDFEETEPEQVKIDRVTAGLRGILKACADSATVRRVVFTSSLSAFFLPRESNNSGITDESSWTDIEFVRSLNVGVGPYVVTKTINEKLAIDLAQELGLDLVSIGPTWITGPFLCPYLPDSVRVSLALIHGDESQYTFLKEMSLVHVEDVARAHIHLFECPEAEGRYLCTGVDVTIEELHEFISKNHPQYKLPKPECWKDVVPTKTSGTSNRRLLDAGFDYKYGIEEMLDDAIECAKEKGFL